jgi:ABC-2 type transport system ATP-binding protein
MNAIEVSNLSITYKGKKFSKVEALKSLNLTVKKGEVFGFLGPNGAGKSTTIKTLVGLISPSAGSATLFDIDISSHESRRRVGYLPENPSLYDFLTAREYLVFVGKSFSMSSAAIAARTLEVLEMLQLVEAADRPVRSYSKGMVQRLGLAQTLLHEPDLYILDEPMSGLDPLGRALVKNIIRQLKQAGKTVFFSTHITADVEAVCDKVAIIDKGELQALESVESILLNGIVGYSVQVSGVHDISGAGYTLSEVQGNLHEYEVSKDCFNEFIGIIAASGGKVELIETKRKDLEEFFLEIVKRDNVPA